MRAGECELREERAEDRHEHILLRVPHVALRAEKSIRSRAARNGRPPFDKLITRAQGETHARDEKEEPETAPARCAPQEHFARNQRGHEALHEMTDAVVIIAREMK